MQDSVNQLLGYLRAVWRRRWTSLGVAWLVCLLGWSAVALLPDQYESRARVFADTDSLLGPLMKGITVDTDISTQIEVMQRTLLSRPNLEQVARAAGLDAGVDDPRERERLLERLRERIAVDADRENLFSVAYTAPDPATAHRVVRSLLTIFIESNVGASRRDMDTARRFIDEQIQVYERELDAAEARLAEFKKRHVGYLPGQGNFYERLQEARGAVIDLQGDIDAAVARRDELARQLAAVPPYVEADDPLLLGLGLRESGGAGVAASPAVRLAEMQAKLSQLLTRYTPRHPDVAALQREIDRLTDAGVTAADGRDAAASRLPRRRVPSPVYERLKVQLVEREAELASLRDQLAKKKAQVAELTELARRVPQVEAELTRLNRDYQVIKENFEELLSRREAARMAQELEVKTDTVEFRVVDPPTEPINPSGPPRRLLLGGVLLVGLVAGALYGVLLGEIDGTFDSVGRLREAFGLPVLGSVSLVASPAGERRQRLARSGFALACLALIGAFGGLLLADSFDLLAALGDQVRTRVLS